MKIKKELNLAFIENVTEKQVYLVGDILFLMGHIIYLVLFHMLGVIEMERYNYFSVGFYTAMIFLIIKVDKRNPFILVVMLEIAIHAALCTYFMGWTTGFAQFLLVIIPIPFYQPLKTKSVPYIVTIVDIFLFVYLKISITGTTPKYFFDKDYTTNTIYLINSFFSFVIIVYISSIYLFSREFTQRKLRFQNETLQTLATIDPLTKLFNRRAMENYMKIIRRTSEENQRPYVIGLGDIDDFKVVNDTYGHGAGDEVLKTVSKIVVSNVPSEGYVCRWGGEEILFAIPSSNGQDGCKAAEKICSELKDFDFKYQGSSFKVTITFGLCEVAPGDDYENAIRIADDRLYIGKENGKNKVIYTN